MPWMPYSSRPARTRAADELRADPARSDQLIAQAAQVSTTTVSSTRAVLVSMYLIGDVPVARRERQPMPRQPSRTRELIQAHPGWSLRRVAAAAGVSTQAAWKMGRKTHGLADAAAVTDAITVVRVIPVSCAHCRTPFTPARPDQLYCRPSCKAAAEARRAAVRQLDRNADRPVQPPEVAAHPPPRIPQLPPAPDFSRGRCATAPAHQRTWWTSDDPDEKQAARSMCGTCPVRPECEQWSLALPLSDPGIYGGHSHKERRKLRQEWLLAIAKAVKG